MRVLAGWVAVNGLVVGAQLFAAATSWAYGTLLLRLAPGLAEEIWAWAMVGGLMVGAGIAFCFWVVGFAQRRG